MVTRVDHGHHHFQRRAADRAGDHVIGDPADRPHQHRQPHGNALQQEQRQRVQARCRQWQPVAGLPGEVKPESDFERHHRQRHPYRAGAQRQQRA
jgi:hypothetical protein